jgi:cell filamentation protein
MLLYPQDSNPVNIAKEDFRFAPVMYLSPSLAHIDTLPQGDFDEIIEK